MFETACGKLPYCGVSNTPNTFRFNVKGPCQGSLASGVICARIRRGHRWTLARLATHSAGGACQVDPVRGFLLSRWSFFLLQTSPLGRAPRFRPLLMSESWEGLLRWKCGDFVKNSAQAPGLCAGARQAMLPKRTLFNSYCLRYRAVLSGFSIRDPAPPAKFPVLATWSAGRPRNPVRPTVSDPKGSSTTAPRMCRGSPAFPFPGNPAWEAGAGAD